MGGLRKATSERDLKEGNWMSEGVGGRKQEGDERNETWKKSK